MIAGLIKRRQKEMGGGEDHSLLRNPVLATDCNRGKPLEQKNFWRSFKAWKIFRNFSQHSQEYFSQSFNATLCLALPNQKNIIVERVAYRPLAWVFVIPPAGIKSGNFKTWIWNSAVTPHRSSCSRVSARAVRHPHRLLTKLASRRVLE